MASPGDGDSQASPAPSAGNDLGKRKRNSRACDRCHRNACKVQQSLYRLDRGLFAVTMAVCALASGRLHNGMPVPESPHPLRLEAVPLFTACYSAAIGAIPNDLMDIEIQDRYQMMKAKAILGSCCLQNGDLKRAITHLGDYTTLMSISGFNIESNWPTNISERERQERRRLFWGAYQQDQYISNSFGFISRIREAKTSVKYPAEVFDDVNITETGILQRPDRVSFLRGWNFCTDLYRLLQSQFIVTTSYL